MRTYTFITAVGVFLLTGCGGGSSGPGPITELPEDITPLSSKISREASRMRPSQSCDDVKAYVANAIAQIYLESPYCFDCDSLWVSSPVPISTTPAALPDQVSGTNTQVAGVDEADLIKADAAGNLYMAHDGQFIIADAFPPTELSESAQIDLNGYAAGVFLIEDQQRAVVLVSGVRDPINVVFPAVVPAPHRRNGTELLFVDISDATAPVVTRKLWVPGYIVSQRRIDGRLHLVLRKSVDIPHTLVIDANFQQLLADYGVAKNGTDDDLTAMLAQQVRAFVSNVVAAMPLEALLTQTAGSDGGDYSFLAPPACDRIHRPDVTINLGLANLVSVDVDGANLDEAAALVSVGSVYTSKDNIYLPQRSSQWWWNPQQADETAIHQFSITNGNAQFVASGVVDGHVDDRFSLDEFDGSLRVATTQRVWDAATRSVGTKSHLFVMQDRADGTLAQVGAVRNFIDDEQIFSARFMGTRGYVVTFRQIDPLFSFDLADPLAPRLAGEIEISGFSSYIHPFDDNHLITIGRGGDATGADSTVQLQLFDVRRLDDPRLLHSYTAHTDGIVAEYAWSVAQYDPHAFTFFAPESLLSVPLSLLDTTAGRSFNGFLALDVDLQGGFVERSRVDHNDLATTAFCGTPDDDPHLCANGSFQSYLIPLRTVVMTDAAGGTFLYTMSDVGLKATPVDDADQVLGSLIF